MIQNTIDYLERVDCSKREINQSLGIKDERAALIKQIIYRKNSLEEKDYLKVVLAVQDHFKEALDEQLTTRELVLVAYLVGMLAGKMQTGALVMSAINDLPEPLNAMAGHAIGLASKAELEKNAR